MRYRFTTAPGLTYHFNPTRFFDISIPLNFQGDHPRAFGAPSATAEPFVLGPVTLATTAGGSCNCYEYRLNVHCNGTHTEGIGHVTDDGASVLSCLPDALLPVTVTTVEPERQKGRPPVITEANLRGKLQGKTEEFLSALVVRTLPNHPSKWNTYSPDLPPPYFEPEALEYLRSKGIHHLITDLPSVDAINDEKLLGHRAFWGLSLESRSSEGASNSSGTITELTYVPDEVEDGYYLLNLQIASFLTDASPSRPLLFVIDETYEKQ